MLVKKRIPVQKCVYTVPVESRPEQKNLVMWVKVQDLPDDLSLDPNARRADVDSKVARQISETLRDAPENFWKLNSGIQMTARDVEVKDGKVVVLDLYDPEDDAEIGDGVINGGHTYGCIRKVRQEAEDALAAAEKPGHREDMRQQFEAINAAVVRVEVLTGLDRKELPDISRARNTGETVKKYSLQNLKKLYDPIKAVLGPEDSKRVGFCENDVDPVQGSTYLVLDLIRLMSLFNNELYPYSQDKHPVVCYSSAGRLVDRWEAEHQTYMPLVSKLRDLMLLHDRAYLMVSKVHEGKKGPRRNGFDRFDHQLPFTGALAEYKVSYAFVLPLVAALRILLGSDGRWRIDPMQFLDSAGPKLITVLMSFYDEQCKGKPHELGRSVGSWRAVAAEARAIFAETMLAGHAA